MRKMEEGASFERCPHCDERPAAGHHLCPLDLETDGCECCGACSKICSDIRGHIVLHTPSVYVDYGTGEMLVTYVEESQPTETPQGDEGEYLGGFGQTA